MSELGVSEPKGKKGTGLQPNLAGLLCYALGWVTGLIFLLLEPRDNKYVRFHAIQSIVVFGVATAAVAALGFFSVFGGIMSWIIRIVAFVLWIVLMVKAYRGERYKLPWAGDFAEKNSQ